MPPAIPIHPHQESPRHLARPVIWTGLALLCYLLVQQLISGSPLATRWFTDLSWTVASLLAALGAWKKARQLTGHVSKAWYWVALACASWFAGILIWDYKELLVLQVTPFPALSDIGFMLFAPAMFMAFFYLRLPQQGIHLTLLQVGLIGILLCSLIMVHVVVLAGPLQSGKHEIVYMASAVAYPVLYMSVLLYGLANLWLFRHTRNIHAYLVLLAAMAVHAFTDSVYAFSLLGYSYATGHYLDIFWLFGFGLIYIASVWQSDEPQKSRAQDNNVSHQRPLFLEGWLSGLALLSVAFTLYLFRDNLHGGNIEIVFFSGLGLIGFIVLRDWASRNTERTLYQKLDESEKQFRSTFEHAASGIGHFAPNGRWLKVNRKFCEISGYSEKELLSMTFHDLSHPDDLAHETNIFNKLVAGGIGELAWEKRFLRRDKSIAWIRITVSAGTTTYENTTHYIAILEDITERRQIESELAAYRSNLEAMVSARTADLEHALQGAESASAAKSEFLSRMSHELRTPLNAVLGFAQLIEMGASTEEEQRDFVDEILRSGRHLLALIDEVLDLSRIESGTINVRPENVEIGMVVRECLQSISPLAREADIEITVNRASQAVDVYALADRHRLTEVLLNLLSNAVKYNSPKGKVSVDYEATENLVKLHVRDNGRGIAPEHFDRVFEPFDRLDADSAIPGTGIGMTIARRLVRMMRGSISIVSVPGEGSCFTISLPASDEHHGSEQAAERGPAESR